jgi:pimeloyl-ACP methyl ester carboxylesterase
LVKTANWLNNLDFDWQSPVWSPLFQRLAGQCRLIRYDGRGMGLSDRDVPDFSFEAWVRDLETVVDGLKLDRVALLGTSQGAPISIAYAVRHPRRVSRLILCGGFAKGWRKRGSAADVAWAEASITLIREGWGQDNPAARQMFTSLIVPDATLEEMRWLNDLERVSASPETAIRMLRVIGDIDIRPVERAFQLAGSGRYASVPDIKKQMMAEGYSVAQITGGALLKQLLALITAARGMTHAKGS